MATRSVIGLKVGFDVKASKSDKFNIYPEHLGDVYEMELPGLPEDEITLKDGDIIAFYNHFDGYPSYMVNMFQTKSAQSLLAEAFLGDGSVLETFVSPEDAEQNFFKLVRREYPSLNVVPCDKHTFDTPCSEVSVKYHRDRGETGTSPRVYKSAKEFFSKEPLRHPDIEYIYLVEIEKNQFPRPFFEAKRIIARDLVDSRQVEWVFDDDWGWVTK